MAWLESIASELTALRDKSLFRELRTVEESDGCHAIVDGQRVVNLCHNDYLGLSRDPEVIEAACRATRLWGTGAGASRLITGTSADIRALEEELADFKGATRALVFPTGYQANLGILGALVGPGDAVFIDRLAHACLVDGVRLSGARLRVFPHSDVARLGELLRAATAAPNRWILVDGVTSMDGDIAPLPELLELAHRHDARILLDDAHATGVLGERGGGTAEHFGIRPRDHEERLLLMCTLSKALGAQGGAFLGAGAVCDWLANRARTFIYTTGLAPGAVGAARAAIAVIRREPDRARRCRERAAAARARLTALHLDTMGSRTPIVPVRLGSAERALAVSRSLLDRGFLALAIRPPTVPRGTSRLRMTFHNLLADDEIDAAVAAVAEAVRP